MNTIESIEKELNGFQDYVAALSYEDIKDMAILNEVLLSLSQKLSRSASLVADATALAAKARKKAYKDYSDLIKLQGYSMAPSILKDYIAAQYPDELHCEVLADRVNRSLTHTMEAVRSILSATKTEFATLRFQT